MKEIIYEAYFNAMANLFSNDPGLDCEGKEAELLHYIRGGFHMADSIIHKIDKQEES